jgi:hypothetical protein
MVELYKNKKLIDALLLAREFNGRVELDLKQSLSDIEKQNIYLNEILEEYFDKPQREERQREMEQEIKRHQELEKMQFQNKSGENND